MSIIVEEIVASWYLPEGDILDTPLLRRARKLRKQDLEKYRKKLIAEENYKLKFNQIRKQKNNNYNDNNYNYNNNNDDDQDVDDVDDEERIRALLPDSLLNNAVPIKKRNWYP